MAELAVVPRLHRPGRAERIVESVAERLATHVEQSVRALLDPDRIQGIAEDLRAVQRVRVHHAGLVVSAFVLSAFEGSRDTQGRILDAWTTYRALGGKDSSETSFRTCAHRLVPVFRELLRRAMERMANRVERRALRGRLERFADVLVPDGCAFKLANALAASFKGTGQAAEFKLHAVYSIGSSGLVDVHSTAGSVHDNDGFHPAKWERNALYIWDLGYNDHERFIDAALAGAIPLQRMKANANPIVIASYGPTGHPRELRDEDGKRLRLNDACEFGFVHKQSVLDLDVQLRDKNHRSFVARVVCVPCDGEDRYYLTMLPRESFTAHDVAELYRLRWEIELFFRTLKGAVRLDEVRRLTNKASLEIAIHASLLAAMLSRDIYDAFERASVELEPAADASPAAFPPGASGAHTLAPAERERRCELLEQAQRRRHARFRRSCCA